MTFPSTRQIPTTVHGRYLIRPAADDSRGLLLGYHGYATNAEHLLKEIAAIPDAVARQASAPSMTII